MLNRLQAQQLQNVAQAAGLPVTLTSDAEAAVASAACCSLFFGFLNVARRLTQIPMRVCASLGETSYVTIPACAAWREGFMLASDPYEVFSPRRVHHLHERPRS